MFKHLQQWLKQVFCLHEDLKLLGICRDPETYRRMGHYRCEVCRREMWLPQLPSELQRERPWK